MGAAQVGALAWLQGTWLACLFQARPGCLGQQLLQAQLLAGKAWPESRFCR